jgi:hypothetical protein
MIARAIHNLSPRRDKAFVMVNCAAIPSGLLESDLFGQERGSFTGAFARRLGDLSWHTKGRCFWMMPAIYRSNCNRSSFAYGRRRNLSDRVVRACYASSNKNRDDKEEQ